MKSLIIIAAMIGLQVGKANERIPTAPTKHPLTEERLKFIESKLYDMCVDGERLDNKGTTFCSCMAITSVKNIRTLHIAYEEDVANRYDDIFPNDKQINVCNEEAKKVSN
jgi:hypothetical protein